MKNLTQRIRQWFYGDLTITNSPNVLIVQRKTHWAAKCLKALGNLYLRSWGWLWTIGIGLTTIYLMTK